MALSLFCQTWFRRAFALSLLSSLALADDKPAEKPAPPRFDGTKAGQVREDNEPKIKLVWCPPGKFRMGSPRDEPLRSFNEGPVEVTLTRGFWLGKYEVTQGQWQRVMKTKPWNGQTSVRERNDFPATFVNWFDAANFCSNLTVSERRAGRLPANWTYALPTDAEWEYACRAGTTTSYSFGDDLLDLPDHAWVDIINLRFGRPDDAWKEQYAHQVGQLKPNEWGLYDMHGNVNEWCQDVYVDGLPGGVDPLVQAKNLNLQVFRGGSWELVPRYCRSAFRNGGSPNTAGSGAGFRVAAVATGK